MLNKWCQQRRWNNFQSFSSFRVESGRSIRRLNSRFRYLTKPMAQPDCRLLFEVEHSDSQAIQNYFAKNRRVKLVHEMQLRHPGSPEVRSQGNYVPLR